MKLIRAVTATLVAGVAVLLASALPAWAHVTVSPSVATAGGYGTFAFKVPNERPDAKTIRVEVVFPENAQLTSASLRPVPGWTATVATRQLPNAASAASAGSDDEAAHKAVTGIVWEGGAIKPGEFQLFEVSLGPLPTTPGQLVFKALQTYSGGEVVRWIDVPEAGAPRPEHPAPVIDVKPADAQANAPAAAIPTPTTTTDDDGVARLLGLAGLALGALALLTAAATWLRPRTPVPASAPLAEADTAGRL
ncbi:YcnI family copper-binding membrane protein [Herbidospora yilanensis]|uniref:YcnI family copper-binding membrane protein n=1 Tax=Herbidospora yilanensis TaxID=354426 RepID=UPI000780DA5A|nr:YcnI family protein [Herbidospora yilanensis]